MGCYAKDLIAVASAEIGYHEKASNSNLQNKYLNSGNKDWNKYADFIDKTYPNFYNGRKNGYAWCDVFNDYCYIKAFGIENALKLLCQPLKSDGAGCRMSYSYYKKAGKVGKTPKVGAQIFFGKSESSLYHTGIVESFDNNRVYTIEGNTSNCVARRSYTLGVYPVFGYGYPDFDIEDTSNTESQKINNIVSSGLSKTIQWYGKVNCSALNIRTWAGIEYPKLSSTPVIYKNTKVGVCGSIKAKDNSTWYYMNYNEKYGFVSAAYITRI